MPLKEPLLQVEGHLSNFHSEQKGLWPVRRIWFVGLLLVSAIIGISSISPWRDNGFLQLQGSSRPTASTDLSELPKVASSDADSGCAKPPVIPGSLAAYPRVQVVNAMISDSGPNLSGIYIEAGKTFSTPSDRKMYRTQPFRGQWDPGDTAYSYLLYGDCKGSGCWMLWSAKGTNCSPSSMEGCKTSDPDAYVIDEALTPDAIQGNWQVCPGAEPLNCRPADAALTVNAPAHIPKGESVTYLFTSGSKVLDSLSSTCSAGGVYSLGGGSIMMTSVAYDAALRSMYTAGASSSPECKKYDDDGYPRGLNSFLPIGAGCAILIVLVGAYCACCRRGKRSKGELEQANGTASSAPPAEPSWTSSVPRAGSKASEASSVPPVSATNLSTFDPHSTAPAWVAPSFTSTTASTTLGANAMLTGTVWSAAATLTSEERRGPRGLLRVAAPGSYLTRECAVSCEVFADEEEDNQASEAIQVLLHRSALPVVMPDDLKQVKDLVDGAWRLTDCRAEPHAVLLKFGRRRRRREPPAIMVPVSPAETPTHRTLKGETLTRGIASGMSQGRWLKEIAAPQEQDQPASPRETSMSLAQKIDKTASPKRDEMNSLAENLKDWLGEQTASPEPKKAPTKKRMSQVSFAETSDQNTAPQTPPRKDMALASSPGSSPSAQGSSSPKRTGMVSSAMPKFSPSSDGPPKLESPG